MTGDTQSLYKEPPWRWLIIKVAYICPDKPSNPLLTTNLLLLALPVMSHQRLTELRRKGSKLGQGKGNKIGEGERHLARIGGKLLSSVSPAQSLG